MIMMTMMKKIANDANQLEITIMIKKLNHLQVIAGSLASSAPLAITGTSGTGRPIDDHEEDADAVDHDGDDDEGEDHRDLRVAQ